MERNITVKDCERANFLEMAHFPEGNFKCESCTDYKIGECEGKGYTCHDEIMDCMIDKVVTTREHMEELGIDEDMMFMSNLDEDDLEDLDLSDIEASDSAGANKKAKAKVKKNKSQMAKKSKKNNRKK